MKRGMRTTGELKKFIGVTKKTLTEYARIGLLFPSNDDEVPYGKQNNLNGKKPWLYNEGAVTKLVFIQILRKAGFTRKSIKKMIVDQKLFEKNDINSLISVYNEAIARMEDELRETRGMLTWLKIQKINCSHMMSLSEDVRNIIIDLSEKTPIESLFTGNYNELVNVFSELSGMDELNDLSDVQIKTSRIGFLLSLVAQFNSGKVESREIQTIVGEAYKVFLELDAEYEIPSFLEFSENIINESYAVLYIEEFDFSIRAVRFFCEQNLNKK